MRPIGSSAVVRTVPVEAPVEAVVEVAAGVAGLDARGMVSMRTGVNT
jgi:hypothetical protein